MQKVLVAASVFVAVVFGSAAFAAESFTLDDSAFDYFDNDEAYVLLEYQDGEFLIQLENEASGGALELAEITDTYPEAQSDRDALTDRELQANLPVAVSGDSANITLESNNLRTVIEQYDAQMATLGFEGDVETNGPNKTIKVYDTDGTQTRVVFSQQGNDVNIYMHLL